MLIYTLLIKPCLWLDGRVQVLSGKDHTTGEGHRGIPSESLTPARCRPVTWFPQGSMQFINGANATSSAIWKVSSAIYLFLPKWNPAMFAFCTLQGLCRCVCVCVGGCGCVRIYCVYTYIYIYNYTICIYTHNMYIYIYIMYIYIYYMYIYIIIQYVYIQCVYTQYVYIYIYIHIYIYTMCIYTICLYICNMYIYIYIYIYIQFIIIFTYHHGWARLKFDTDRYHLYNIPTLELPPRIQKKKGGSKPGPLSSTSVGKGSCIQCGCFVGQSQSKLFR